MRRNILRFAFPVGIALAAACSSSSSSAPGGFQPINSGGSGSNNGSSGGSSNGAAAGDTNGTTGGSTGGITCGSQTCTSSQVCCFGSTPMPGMGTCMDPSACTGSSLACSATSACSNSQVCCFTYNPSTSSASATDDSGAPGAGLGGFGGFGGGTATTGAGVPFTAACQDSCPAATSYQLCDVSSTTDCPSGDTCTTYMATYTPYCAAGGGGLAGLGDGGFGGGFPTTNPFGDAGFGLPPAMGTADADVGEAGPDE